MIFINFPRTVFQVECETYLFTETGNYLYVTGAGYCTDRIQNIRVSRLCIYGLTYCSMILRNEMEKNDRFLPITSYGLQNNRKTISGTKYIPRHSVQAPFTLQWHAIHLATTVGDKMVHLGNANPSYHQRADKPNATDNSANWKGATGNINGNKPKLWLICGI